MKTQTDPLQAARTCELHVHIGGCFSVDDLIHLGGPVVDRIDWSIFTRDYERVFGVRGKGDGLGRNLDPADWIRRAAAGDRDAIASIRRHYLYTEADGADFERFMARLNLAIAVLRHHRLHGDYEQCVERVVEGHRQQGIAYVEFRAWIPTGSQNPDEHLRFHRDNARVIAAACRPGFTARYVPSISRSEPEAGYQLLRRWLDDDPAARAVVTGFDFCHFEEGFAPHTTRGFFDQFARHEARSDDPPLQVLYHVGEIYFDKSLESAVRWCHEAAELGANRLGHCIALGLDPVVAVARHQHAHVAELVSERIDQIGYDLRHYQGLEDAGVVVDAKRLQKERAILRGRGPTDLLQRAYDEERLVQIRHRQQFVLKDLARRGTVIECCPTSNMRLGSVPGIGDHPVHRLLASDVALAIGADDPGIFDSPLAAEVEWVARHTDLSRQALADRLGDPRRFVSHCG